MNDGVWWWGPLSSADQRSRLHSSMDAPKGDWVGRIKLKIKQKKENGKIVLLSEQIKVFYPYQGFLSLPRFSILTKVFYPYQGFLSLPRFSILTKVFNPYQGFQSLPRFSILTKVFSPSQGFLSLPMFSIVIPRFSTLYTRISALINGFYGLNQCTYFGSKIFPPSL